MVPISGVSQLLPPGASAEDIIARPGSPHCSGTSAYCLLNLCSLLPGYALQEVLIMLQANGLLASQGGLVADIFEGPETLEKKQAK